MADDFDTSDREDDSFTSPPPEPTPAGRSKTPTRQGSRFDTDESREAALRKELEGVRKVNQVIEGVIGTLERARGNMGVRYVGINLQTDMPAYRPTYGFSLPASHHIMH